MGFLNRILITGILCCAYHHHASGQEAIAPLIASAPLVTLAASDVSASASDSCENKVYTNDMVSSTPSNFMIGNQLFHLNPKALAAFDCCHGRKQNLHCTNVCLFRAKRMMNDDGTWNKPGLIRAIIEDWKMEIGPEVIMRVFQCIDKYGPYKPSSNCHDIEKHYTCVQNHFLEFQPGRLTSYFINNYNLDVAHWKCGNRTYHIPEPFMELAQDCLANATTVYERLRCTWKAFGILDEKLNVNAAATLNLYKLTFGRRGYELTERIMSRMKPNGKLWRDSVEQPDNAITILSDYIANAREAVYEVCGTRTDDFINSC